MGKRRGNHEGSIFHRSDGSWVAEVSIDGHRVTKYFKTQRECREWIRTTREQIDAGLSWKGAQVTLGDFLLEWLKMAETQVRPKTIEQYTQIVHQHILPALGKLKMKDLRPDHIQALYNQKLDQGASERTVVLIHAVLHRALRQALQLGITPRNAADAAIKPKLKRKEMKTLDEIQVRSLILAAKGTRFEALFQIAVTTGLRLGEILGLKWTDLDWTSRKLQIQRQSQRLKGQGLVLSEPKTAKSRRTVMIGAATIQKMRDHQDIQHMERSFMGDRWIENNLIFPNAVGNQLDHANLLKAFKGFLEKAGLPDLRFHDLRHTAATLMLQQDVHPKIVQERLGHSDISLTLNTYSHVLPSMQDSAADKMDDLLTLTDVTQDLAPKVKAPK
jgi:integrase